jgi:hypothetical protein
MFCFLFDDLDLVHFQSLDVDSGIWIRLKYRREPQSCFMNHLLFGVCFYIFLISITTTLVSVSLEGFPFLIFRFFLVQHFVQLRYEWLFLFEF